MRVELIRNMPDLIPMAREMALGVIPWSPLASGVLTGKYSKADLEIGTGSASAVGSRKNVAAAGGALDERGLAIAEVVKALATETGKSPPQVALAWTLLNPAVAAPIMGVRTLAQLEDNLGALEVVLTHDQRARLDAASAIDFGFPHEFLARPMTRNVMFGDMKIATRN